MPERNSWGTLSALLFLCISKQALGYLDPGTGSYILQVTIAALFGGLFALKLFWKNIVRFFKSLFSKRPEELMTEQSPTDTQTGEHTENHS
jgi:hypothetical protein